MMKNGKRFIIIFFLFIFQTCFLLNASRTGPDYLGILNDLTGYHGKPFPGTYNDMKKYAPEIEQWIKQSGYKFDEVTFSKLLKISNFAISQLWKNAIEILAIVRACKVEWMILMRMLKNIGS